MRKHNPPTPARSSILNRAPAATSELQPSVVASLPVPAAPVQARFGHSFSKLAMTAEQALQHQKNTSAEETQEESGQQQVVSAPAQLVAAPPPPSPSTTPAQQATPGQAQSRFGLSFSRLPLTSRSESPLQLMTNTKFNLNGQYSTEMEMLTDREPSKESSLDLTAKSQAHGLGTAYIVNAIVSYAEIQEQGKLAAVIAAMTNGLEADGTGRIAIIIGVNAKVTKAKELNAAIDSVQDVIEDYPFPIALVPMTYDSDKFPYGQMRNQVLHSAETRKMTEYFVHLRLHPYISIQDFDTGSRRVGDEKGKHIFEAIDDMLKPMFDDEAEGGMDEEINKNDKINMEINMEEGGGMHEDEDRGMDEDEDGGMDSLPLMIAGGYRGGNIEKLHKLTQERLRKQDVTISDEELTQHLEKFVREIQQDMAHRQQQARLHPLLPYAPEPNLFLDATAVMSGSPKGQKLDFSPGGAEFTEMGKNVTRFAADELETLYTQKYQAGLQELHKRGISEKSPEAQKLLEGLRTQMMIHAQNNRHPLRGKTVMADFENLNVETDLSRLAASSVTRSRTAQSHEGLTEVVNRFFNTKADKKGVKLSQHSKEFSKELRSLASIHDLDPGNKKWEGKPFGLGKKMSEALSVPYKSESLFSGMNYGVQSNQKKYMLHQIAIEPQMREYMDEQVDLHKGLIANFQQQPYPLYGTDVKMNVDTWTKADGDCGVYALGHLLGVSLTRPQLVKLLQKINTAEAQYAVQGISGFNQTRWLASEQLAAIGQLLGLNDIAIVTFNLTLNSWAVHSGNPVTSSRIIGGVPASVGGSINHWVVLKRT